MSVSQSVRLIIINNNFGWSKLTLAVPTRYSKVVPTTYLPSFFRLSLRIALVDGPTGSIFFVFSCSPERKRDDIPAQFPQRFSRFSF